MEPLNIATLAKHFSDESSAWDLVESLRWPDGPVCPYCSKVVKAYRLADALTTTGRKSYRRTWKCASCRRKFSVLVGTIFESTQIRLSKWLMAIYLLSASKNGVAAYELHRTLGVTHKTAWFMVHRIREGMKVAPFSAMFSGTVAADETWVGGKDRNRHAHKRQGHDESEKSIVLSVVSRETGEVRSQVIPDAQGFTLSEAIGRVAAKERTILHTDGWAGYGFIAWEFKGHEFVNHAAGEYARNGVTTNLVEGYFGQFKRSVDGTHHHISKQHTARYLAEFDFRYSTCKISDSERMVKLMGQTSGKRLTYKRLIGKP
ncbi:MAG TPA: IS1595 family transposase [Acidimicrobiales bacterium]|nr:IS1595 family transposase [Acidimicrobiales bacterium]